MVKKTNKTKKCCPNKANKTDKDNNNLLIVGGVVVAGGLAYALTRKDKEETDTIVIPDITNQPNLSRMLSARRPPATQVRALVSGYNSAARSYLLQNAGLYTSQGGRKLYVVSESETFIEPKAGAFTAAELAAFTHNDAGDVLFLAAVIKTLSNGDKVINDAKAIAKVVRKVRFIDAETNKVVAQGVSMGDTANSAKDPEFLGTRSDKGWDLDYSEGICYSPLAGNGRQWAFPISN